MTDQIINDHVYNDPLSNELNILKNEIIFLLLQQLEQQNKYELFLSMLIKESKLLTFEAMTELCTGRKSIDLYDSEFIINQQSKFSTLFKFNNLIVDSKKEKLIQKERYDNYNLLNKLEISKGIYSDGETVKVINISFQEGNRQEKPNSDVLRESQMVFLTDLESSFKTDLNQHYECNNIDSQDNQEILKESTLCCTNSSAELSSWIASQKFYGILSNLQNNQDVLQTKSLALSKRSSFIDQSMENSSPSLSSAELKVSTSGEFKRRLSVTNLVAQQLKYEMMAKHVLAESELAKVNALEVSSRNAFEQVLSNNCNLLEQQTKYEMVAKEVLMESQLAVVRALDLSSREAAEQVILHHLNLQEQQDKNESVVAKLIFESQSAIAKALELSHRNSFEQKSINTLNLLEQRLHYEKLSAKLLTESQLVTVRALELSSKEAADLMSISNNNLNDQKEKNEALAAKILAESQLAVIEALTLSSKEAMEQVSISDFNLSEQQFKYEALSAKLLVESQLATSKALELSSREASEQKTLTNFNLLEQQLKFKTLAAKLLTESQIATVKALELSSREASAQQLISNATLRDQQLKYETLSAKLLFDSQSATSKALELSCKEASEQKTINSVIMLEQKLKFETIAKDLLTESELATSKALELSSREASEQKNLNIVNMQEQQLKYEIITKQLLVESQLATIRALELSSNEASEQSSINNTNLQEQQERNDIILKQILVESQQATAKALELSSREASEQVIRNNFVLQELKRGYEELAANVLTDSQLAMAEAIILSTRDIEFQTNLNSELSSILESLTLEVAEKDVNFILIKMANERLHKQIATTHIERIAAAAVEETGQVRALYANVAHDLKTPLHAALLGIDSLIRFGLGFSPEDKEILNSLESSCHFMSSLINRTIDSAKSDAGVTLVPILTSFDIVNSLNIPIGWMKPHLELGKSTITVTNRLPKEVVRLFSDNSWIQENLLCYLSNSVKYSSGGNIEIVLSMINDVIRISVEDHGIGISKDAKAGLFQKFSQVNRMTLGGTGLGLYSLRIRSNAIGGSCGVEDRGDGTQGSVFWFSFPYRPDFEDDFSMDLSSSSVIKKIKNAENRISTTAITSTATTTPTITTEQEKKLSILIIDDSETVTKVLSNMIRRMGFDVRVQENGLLGLNEMMRCSDELDLVLMDLQMPVMDGIESTKRFRAFELQQQQQHSEGREIINTDFFIHNLLEPIIIDNSINLPPKSRKSFFRKSFNSSNPLPDISISRIRLPIICSSANDCEVTTGLALSAGVDGFLPKPFSYKQLATVINTYKKNRNISN